MQRRMPAGRRWAWIPAIAVTLALAAMPSGAAAPGRLQVQSIVIDAQGAATRVDLRLTRESPYTLFTLTGPDRVVLDIPTAALGPGALPLPAPAGAIRGLRVAHRTGGHLRIVFDVAEPFQPAGSLKPDGAASRLSLELRPVSRFAAAPPPPPVPVAVPVVPDPPAVARDDLAPAARLPAPPPGRVVTVAVDAGHGGHDPGAIGPSGLREKDVTLALSRRLVALINAEPDMRAVLTRSDDRFVGLRERMEKARGASADLFISVHADAALNRSARGSTVYVLSSKGASDEASRRLAARENAALIGGVELGDKDPVLASVLMDLSQNASISSSIAVGTEILGHMGRLGSLHRRTVQQAPFMVLKSPDVPSVLVETAYISNPQDEARLRSDRHRDDMARAILGGIRSYFAANPPAPGAAPVSRPTLITASAGVGRDSRPVVPARHVVQRGDTLSGVASLYGISLNSLRSANSLRGDVVRVGQTLRIPRESS